MAMIWKVPSNVEEIFETIKTEHHPHLATAHIALSFDDSKPYRKNRLNLGKVSKFSPFQRLWHAATKYDFSICLCSDVWHSILTPPQRLALADLHLTRCSVERLPKTVTENGKEKVIKDEFGFVEYTDEVKFDDEGNPLWAVLPLDLEVICANVARYGLWYSPLTQLYETMTSKEHVTA